MEVQHYIKHLFLGLNSGGLCVCGGGGGGGGGGGSMLYTSLVQKQWQNWLSGYYLIKLNF